MFPQIILSRGGFQWVFPGGSVVKNPPANLGDQKILVWSLGQEDALEEEMATHSSILPWKYPMDRRAWWATVHGGTKSQTQWADMLTNGFWRGPENLLDKF